MRHFFSEQRSHQLLTRAALDRGPRGRKSFESWRQRVRLTDVDYPSQKMLSAVGHHLTGDLASVQVGKVARFTWLRSQMLLRAGFRAQEALCNAGIPVAWIKGTAVLLRTSTPIATRPMDDIDLLVSLGDVANATACLNAAGFNSGADKELIQCPKLITDNQHGIAFRDVSGAEVDLHWQTFKGAMRRASEHEVWLRSSIVTRFGKSHRVISAEDLLLQIIATNREGNDAYWILDAIRVIESNCIDFPLLLEIAKQRQLWRMCMVGLANISTFRPRAIPVPWRTQSAIFRIIYAAGQWVSGSATGRNLAELPKLVIGKSLDFPAPSEAGLNSEWVSTQRNIRLGTEQTVLSFGRARQPWFRNAVAVSNWHASEQSGNWSSARDAHLQFSIPDDIKTVKITAAYSVISSRYAKLRAVGIYLDGLLMERRILFNPHGHIQKSQFFISRANFSGPMTLSFRVSSTIMPLKHGLNQDQRNLGIFLHQVTLSRHLD